MTIPKRCFVVSPIGEKGSRIREHADDVFDFIITPAADEFGITPVRSDNLHEPGRISEQMYREIITSNCCICILTGHNPNVFYELAVAQTIGTAVIILIEKDEKLPFDIQDHRCVRYDLSLRANRDGKYAKEVVAHLRTLEAASWRSAPLFGDADRLRHQRLGLPQSLIDELLVPIEQRKETLSTQQKQLLFKIQSLCLFNGIATQHDIAAHFNKAHTDNELYYRMENLRFLGFIEKRRNPAGQFFEYSISSVYSNTLSE